MTGDSRPWAVILTGGALPGCEIPDPADLEYALASGRTDISLAEATPAGVRLAREMYQLGYDRAAQVHRIVAVWVIDGEERAAGFAQWVTREIDPAYVKHVSDPLAEMLCAADRLEDTS